MFLVVGDAAIPKNLKSLWDRFAPDNLNDSDIKAGQYQRQADHFQDLAKPALTREVQKVRELTRL